MDVKKIILIVGAMFVALGAAFGVNQLMRGSTAPEARAAAAPEITGPKVMVATRALPVGTILTADAMRFQPWPEGMVKPDQYYVEGAAQVTALVGSVVRVPMTAGAPVTRGSLVNPGDRGFLAAALGPGMRAVTVPLSAFPATVSISCLPSNLRMRKMARSS
jgi:pilus assembly protein CpaB